MSEFIVSTLNIILILVLSSGFYKSTNELRDFYWPSLVLKIICGILYGLIYLYHFKGGDTLAYFNQAAEVAEVAKGNLISYLKFLLFNENQELFTISYSPIYHARAYWMTKAISPFLLITNNNYWLVSCYLSMFCFWGIYFLADTLVKIYPKEKISILISFFLFPSFVFWSSGLTKESIAIGCLFYLIAIALKLHSSLKISLLEWTLAIVFVWIELRIRFFYLAAYMLTFVAFLFYFQVSKSLRLNGFKKGILFIVVTGGVLMLISQMDYALNISNFLDTLIESSTVQYNNNPDNAVQYHNLEKNYMSLVINSPLAIVSGLFRPSLLDAHYWLMFFVGIENLILLVLLLTRLRNLRYNTLELASWAYILILALFLALSSPNFGSLTRYKVGFLPLFLFLLLKEHPLLQKLQTFFKNSFNK